MRFMVGNERSQMRFSDVYSLDLPECLWSASQCLTTRVCGPWYGSPSVAEEQLFLPMDSWAGMSIEEVNIYTWRDPRCHNIYNWLAVKIAFSDHFVSSTIILIISGLSDEHFSDAQCISLPMNTAWMYQLWNSQDKKHEARRRRKQWIIINEVILFSYLMPLYML